jgi:phosphohistidine phosphatase
MASNSTRQLVLLRHAKSAWLDVLDHDRPLAKRGLRDAPGAGRWLRQAGYVPDLVVCSTARRTSETWELAAAELGTSPSVRFERRVYEASTDQLLQLVRESPATAGTLLVVGHEPTMSQLTLLLARTAADSADGADGALERVSLKFPTAAIAVLQFTGVWPDLGPGRAQLADFVVPADYGG